MFIYLYSYYYYTIYYYYIALILWYTQSSPLSLFYNNKLRGLEVDVSSFFSCLYLVTRGERERDSRVLIAKLFLSLSLSF